MSIQRVTPSGFINETGSVARVSPSGFINESGVATVAYFLSGEVTRGGWDTAPTPSATLGSVLDEGAVPDDTDFIQSALNPAGDVCEIKFLNVQTPNSTSGHVISYRIKGDGTTTLVVSLVCNTTIIKTWTHSPAPSTFTQYDQTLTTTEAGTIADYSNLRLRFTAS